MSVSRELSFHTDREELNERLRTMSALKRVEWALGQSFGPPVLSSSFGAQAAASLHLVTQVMPDIPIVFVDTGYHFPETYQFADQLSERLNLNLRVIRPDLSAAWQEARFGRRWEQGIEGIRAYNVDNKVEPMQEAMKSLGAGLWIAGLRRSQSTSRAAAPFITRDQGRWKLHPIADWRDRDVGAYLRDHDLPYHPLWYQGFVSIGDTHTTRSLAEAGSQEATRFFGLARECGLHEGSLTG